MALEIKIEDDVVHLYVDGVPEPPLQYLLNLGEYGVYCNHGRLDITTAQAARHNELVEQSRLAAFERLKVGEEMTEFFLSWDNDDNWLLKSYMGAVISDNIKFTATSIRFGFKGRTFEGGVFASNLRFTFRRVR